MPRGTRIEHGHDSFGWYGSYKDDDKENVYMPRVIYGLFGEPCRVMGKIIRDMEMKEMPEKISLCKIADELPDYLAEGYLCIDEYGLDQSNPYKEVRCYCFAGFLLKNIGWNDEDMLNYASPDQEMIDDIQRYYGLSEAELNNMILENDEVEEKNRVERMKQAARDMCKIIDEREARADGLIF